MLQKRSIQCAAGLVLGGGLFAAGCQLVAGLTDFTVDQDAGSEAGAGSCKTRNDCPKDQFCASGVHQCADCGVSPPDAKCAEDCPSCTRSVCTRSCADHLDGGSPADGGTCPTMVKLDAREGPVVFECGSDCVGVQFACEGPYPCRLICDAGCSDVQFACDPEGACTLECHGGGCASSKQFCGSNACDLECSQPVVVAQACQGGCLCLKHGCE